MRLTLSWTWSIPLLVPRWMTTEEMNSRTVDHRLDEPRQIIPQHGCVPADPRTSESSGAHPGTVRLTAGAGSWLPMRRPATLAAAAPCRRCVDLLCTARTVDTEIRFCAFRLLQNSTARVRLVRTDRRDMPTIAVAQHHFCDTPLTSVPGRVSHWTPTTWPASATVRPSSVSWFGDDGPRKFPSRGGHHTAPDGCRIRARVRSWPVPLPADVPWRKHHGG